MNEKFQLSEIKHHYGDDVHILSDPFLSTQLAALCSPEVGQPRFNQLVRSLYTSLIRSVISHAFPRSNVECATRMIESTPKGILRGSMISQTTSTVVVDIARAGILPSQVCFDTLNEILDPAMVRQDHIIMARTVDMKNRVIGAEISGHKIGGPIEGVHLMFPDPMGATGNSLAQAISLFKEGDLGTPAAIFSLNLIVTPQFIRRLKSTHPECIIYALRLDRGMSDSDVLKTVPGTYWDRENGLDENDYIVPGGGGFGELMNNSWV